MNFERSLFMSCGLIFVLLLISISSGFSLTFQPKGMIFSEISFFCCSELIDSPEKINNEKDSSEKDKPDFKKNRRNQDKNAQVSKKVDFSTSSDQEGEKDSAVKSYNQLKGLLEEVDMMVSEWI